MQRYGNLKGITHIIWSSGIEAVSISGSYDWNNYAAKELLAA